MPPKSARWSLQDAKAQFSEVVRRCLSSGPQFVTRNGEDAVVIVSSAEYNRVAPSRAGESFARFLAESPLAEVNLEMPRPRNSGRTVGL